MEKVPPDLSSASRNRGSVITALATGAAKRWRITLAAFIAVLLAGIWAYGPGLDREGFPPINTPVALITGTYFVDDPAQVDSDVVVPIEAEVRQADGVIETQTIANANNFVVVAEFESGTSSEDGAEVLAALTLAIPPEADIEIESINAAKFVGEYDMIVSVTGPAGATAADLQAQAEAAAQFLQDDAEIARAEVRDLLTESVNPATGELETRQTRFTRVSLGPDAFEESIGIGLVRTETTDLDVLAFSDRVDDILSGGVPLADGYAAEITADYAVGVNQQLSSLLSNLLTGLLAVAVVSLILLGWRVAIITTGFMAVVMLGALLGLWGTGNTLNTITLFGLILTLGLLVDDAIVISESIDANRNEPDPREDDERLGIIRRAIDRVGSASLSGTLTTAVVFSPMLFVGGILGEFIRPIPTTVIVTLMLSFLFSIVFIPLIARLFLLTGKPNDNVFVRGLRAAANALGRLAAFPSGNGAKGWIAGLVLAGLAVGSVVSGIGIAGGLGFSIFPRGKDATGMNVNAEFPPGTSFQQAQAIATQIDDAAAEVLGDELLTAQYVRGNERLIEAFYDLTPIDERDTKAPEFVDDLQDRFDQIAGARVTAQQVENGPPTLDFPFAVQIDATENPAAAEQLAADLVQDLIGLEVDGGGDPVTIIDAKISTANQVARVDGERYIEVSAKYSEDQGVSGLLNETESLVGELHPASDLEARGLAGDALAFDFGDESDNQEDFAGLQIAGLVALALMLLFLTVQFRSLAQSLLIFLAIPFSFLGVFVALSATDNPLSFLAVVGFIALIGVAVNNSILLVDAANQERRNGATAAEAISSAIASRFRPLITTTITTVAGLYPLAVSDPFWESLGFTLMGGLISSTVLVLLAFPVFYLALEAVRTPLRNAVRRRTGRPLVA